MSDFTKENFVNFWPGGYYAPWDAIGGSEEELFNTCIRPYQSTGRTALEIGPGGGHWSNKMTGFKSLTLVDVIPRSDRIAIQCDYIELPKADYSLPGIPDASIDYCFSWGCFCHLSRIAVRQYLSAIKRVATERFEGFVMFGDWNRNEQTKDIQNPEDFLDSIHGMGWAYQTPGLCEQWIKEAGLEVVNRDLFPGWRDCAVHFKNLNH